ncbi:MAG TPA: segregation/condensation protein A [Chitinivibrionales bacterium]
MQAKQEYEVKLSLFEGPLDLLLYLVNKAEVDIVQIPVAQIAEQYLQYLDLMRELNIDIAAEYLYMASTLIRLKARELLPPVEGEKIEEEEGIFNKQQLIEQLLEFKKFKEAAMSLRHSEAEQIGCFTRGSADQPGFEAPSDEACFIGNITVFDLLTAFKRILERTVDNKNFHVINADNVKIDDRIERVLSVLSDVGELRFEELFTDDTRKIVLVVTFMAILELIKMGEISFRQEEQFGAIFVKRTPSEPAPLSTQDSIPSDEASPS